MSTDAQVANAHTVLHEDDQQHFIPAEKTGNCMDCPNVCMIIKLRLMDLCISKLPK
jgi:hypothetical protein